MSLGAIIAFNSAVNQMKQNQMDQQNLQQAQLKTEEQATALDIQKRTAESQIKIANNAGLVNDYQTQNQLDILKKIHGALSDNLDAQSDAQDLTAHKLQQQNQQAQTVAKSAAQDPDVQNHLSTMFSTIAGRPSSAPPMSTPGGQVSGDQTMGTPPQSRIPSIFPQQPTQQPQSGMALAGINSPSSPQGMDAQTRAGGVQQPSAPAAGSQAGSPLAPQGQGASGAPEAQPSTASPDQQGGIQGVSRSLEKAYGMPEGSMWIDPSTGQPGMNPLYMEQKKAELTAQANVEARQPDIDRELKFHQDEEANRRWDTITKETDPDLASSRTPLGQVTRSTYAINKAKDILSDPNVTFEEAKDAMSELSDTFKENDGQGYRTLYGNVKGMLQFVTGTPQKGVPDDIKARIIQNLNQVQSVNYKLLSSQVAETEAKNSDVINYKPEFQEQWANYKAKLLNDAKGDQVGQTSGQGAQPNGQGSQKDYSSLWK